MLGAGADALRLALGTRTTAVRNQICQSGIIATAFASAPGDILSDLEREHEVFHRFVLGEVGEELRRRLSQAEKLIKAPARAGDGP